MFETMACSSKLVEPMMIVGLLDALVEAPGGHGRNGEGRGQRRSGLRQSESG